MKSLNIIIELHDDQDVQDWVDFIDLHILSRCTCNVDETVCPVMTKRYFNTSQVKSVKETKVG